jgi:photosystem II stability/assembly factor-like uncharacterized protein
MKSFRTASNLTRALPSRVLFFLGLGLLGSILPLAAHQPHDPIDVIAASPNFAQDHTVLAATDYLTVSIGAYAVLKSTNGAGTWQVLPDLPNTQYTAIVFSPGYAQDQTIFVACYKGLFRTTNAGASWAQVGAAQMPAIVQGIALSANYTSDHTLFATTTTTIYKSVNAGNTWSNIPAPSVATSPLTVIAESPTYASDKTILLGTTSNGIFRSANGGSTWTSVTPGLTAQVTALTFSPGFASDQTIFATAYGAGFLVSKNKGVGWGAANSGITDFNATSIALSPNFLTDSTLWVTTAVNGVYQSSNGGGSWTQQAAINRILSFQTTDHYRVVAAAATGSGSELFLATFEGVWSSLNSSAGWQYSDTIPTRLVRHMLLSPTYPQDHTVFSTTYGGGNLWSATTGQTWTFYNTGFIDPYPDAIGFSPNFSADQMVFAGNVYGLERSLDGGPIWSKTNALGAHTYVRGLAVSPNFTQDSTVLIGTDNRDSLNPTTVTYQGKQYPNQGLFLSTDGGNDWVPTTLGGPSVNAIAISPAFATDRTAFAASASNGFYKSTDGGMTWTQIIIPGASIQTTRVVVSSGYTTDQTVITSTNSGIFKSTDGGSTWAPLPGAAGYVAMDIQLSPNYPTDQTIFIGTLQNGLLKSTDGGQTFAPTSLTDNFITAVALSPGYATDQTLFAAGYLGIFESNNGGATWRYTVEPARTEQDRANLPNNPQQAPPTIVYQGNWATQAWITPPTPSMETLLYTTETNDSATFQFYGSSVRLLCLTGPGGGTASIQVDGGTPTTVSMHASQQLFQTPVWSVQHLTCGLHTVVLTNLSTNGQSINLDAFDTWQDTCPH